MALLLVAASSSSLCAPSAGSIRPLVSPRVAAARMVSSPCGFIGLGIMGKGMASQLLSAGIPLVVWSRDESAGLDLAAQAGEGEGGEVTLADSPQQVVQSCLRTYLMLPTPAVCHEVYHQEGGVLAGVCEGKQIIDCATLRVEDMEARALPPAAGASLEASQGPAAAGQLIFMVAGDKEVYTAATPELDAMGKAAIYCGEVGMATKMKLVVNMVMSTQLAALAEGVALGRSLGLDGEQLQGVMEQGAVASPMLKLKGPLMAKSDHTPNFPLKYALKDLEFALEEARVLVGADAESRSEDAETEAAMEYGELPVFVFEDAHQPLLPSWVVTCITINVIMGSGFLGVPSAFLSSGPLLGALVLLVVSVLMWIAACYLAQVASRAHALLVDEKSAATLTPTLTPLSALNNAIAEKPGEMPSLLIPSHTSYEIPMLCRLYLGRWVERFVMISLGLFQLGSLWSYASVFASSMAAIVPLPGLLGEEQSMEPCDIYKTDTYGGGCITLYYFWALSFAVAMVALLGLDVREQAYMQCFMTLLRAVILAVM
ncbi:MAG: hypothetical protein SGPRY_007631, partial [Prymnesium sp.]